MPDQPDTSTAEPTGDADLFDPVRDLPGFDVARAKRYSRIRLGFLATGVAWSVGRSTAFGFGGGSARLRSAAGRVAPHPALTDPLYLVAHGLGSWLSRLPLAYLGGHRVERAFGLTSQSTRGWLGDEAKGLAVSLALQIPATTAVYAVIRRRPKDWWLLVSGAAVPAIVVLSQLAPVLILPIFNRFELLEDRELAERIKRLADRAGVPIADVYQMDLSRQTEKANAFFTGLGATKRIVLGDTLLARFSPEEIEGVVAHELGHQVHGDIWRLLALGSAFGVAGSYVVARLGPWSVRRSARLTGVADIGDVASLPILELLLTGIGLAAAPIQAAVSRAIEHRTDRYALALTGDGETYAVAMGRLATQNLADPDPPHAIVLLLYSHPPIAERIRTARAFGRRPVGPARPSAAAPAG